MIKVQFNCVEKQGDKAELLSNSLLYSALSYDLKNYADRKWGLSALADNTVRVLHNSSGHMKADSIIVLLFII